MIATIMDLIDGMRTFTQVVAAGSFTGGAERLGVSKKLVSKYIGQLEERLGSRLLHRTTRSLSLTEVGTLYHAGCLQLLDDLEELELTVQNQVASPRGKLLISAPSTFGEMYVAPQVSKFLELYPQVSVDLRLTDRYVNLVDEGFDLAIRIGDLESSGLIAKKLAPSPMILCASPDYLKQKGTPAHPDDLKGLDCIIDTNFRPGKSWPFIVNRQRISVTVNGALAVNSARSAREFALNGNGIAFCPGFIVMPDIKTGRLIPLLNEYNAFDLNINAIYNGTRNLAPKVRVFIDFLAKTFSAENNLCHLGD
ncbi:LysR family transcriptional regulator [Kiloniella majae]|uniref:LysR family transcriptional regulator n=2 Tax=Kiloniella majae TaxID=1938558 RepID=UPI000A278293|nr:LysR family transcriptional regulator [Kiloniella majae]